MTPRGEVGHEGEVAGVIRVRGGATPEEVAAVVAVLATLSSAGADVPDGARSPVGVDRRTGRWGGPRAAIRHPLDHAPGAWQRTYRT
ncbi:MAG: acyl-CoA carboxylase epsilon subunit [Dermatophilaceae bacterium]